MTAEVDMRTIQRALFVVSCFAGVAAFAADGVAFVTNLKGEVTLENGARVQILSELAKGQKISVGKDAQATVMYIASGKEFSLKGPGQYVAGDAELVAASGAPPATRSTEWRASNKVLVQVAQTSAASMRMRSIAPAKAEPPAKLVYPTQGNIASLQPTFRWSLADPKASSEFTLSVVGQDKPVHQGKVSGTTYRLPARLKPETEYVWVVSTGGAEIGTGKFRTLPTEAVQRVEKRKPAEKSEFSDRVLHALLLQELGATQEAQEAWAKLAQERSDLPELAAFAR
jgi:hypothetical protein